MGSGASVEGAHTQPTRGQNRYFCHICRLAFNTSETSASVPCPRCGDTFVESVEEVSYSGGGRTAFRVFHGGGRSDLEQMELSEEQRRRLFNAAALLQLLEAHLREELMALERAVRESESNKTPHELTSLEKHTYLRSATIDKEAMCAQPSCPICGEDFFVGETALQIQCSHLFHEKCVVPWLELKHNCPICRLDVSEKLPQPAELEELTVAEIKQRIQWHGGQPESTEDKSRLANDLHLILLHHRESYEDRKEPADAGNDDQAVEGGQQSSRPGHTYTISSRGMIRQASGPISSLSPEEDQDVVVEPVATAAAAAPTASVDAHISTAAESVVSSI